MFITVEKKGDVPSSAINAGGGYGLNQDDGMHTASASTGPKYLSQPLWMRKKVLCKDGERVYSGRGYAGITAAFIEVGVHAHVEMIDRGAGGNP